ncbi:hypothetical protein ACI01nite_14320 [Acetobacter cibinongensis]|uniref:Uncharacterized protein n=2 Tax=Acetobacter cibinongensis TaxID=146475 RepID=A0A0D6N4C6_9PROT|nr:hypothetical protein [Acetobacter cibinongensis]GAN60799.1 hypothetical protein Abci_016_145 [Acetobacter cibinongensis]GEL58830.1 hypothetical protein ACI01nite_14320 [Acetobacter cibinongensis]
MSDINIKASSVANFLRGRAMVHQKFLKFGLDLARRSSDSYSIKLQEKMALALGMIGL